MLGQISKLVTDQVTFGENKNSSSLLMQKNNNNNTIPWNYCML